MGRPSRSRRPEAPSPRGRTEEDHSHQRVPNLGVLLLLGQFCKILAERECPAGAVVRRAEGIPGGQGAPPSPSLRVPARRPRRCERGEGAQVGSWGVPSPVPIQVYPVAAGSPTCGTPSPRVCKPLERGRSLSTTRCRPQGVCGEARGAGRERRASSEQGASSVGGSSSPAVPPWLTTPATAELPAGTSSTWTPWPASPWSAGNPEPSAGSPVQQVRRPLRCGYTWGAAREQVGLCSRWGLPAET